MYKRQLLDEAQGILDCDANVTKVANTYLRHKVMPEAEDETVTVSYTHLDVYKRQTHDIAVVDLDSPCDNLAVFAELARFFNILCFDRGGCLLYTSRCV